MSKLRVLQFITPSGFYGAERWVLALANNIDRKVVQCDLVVTKESDEQDLSLVDYYPEDVGNVHILEMNGRFDLRVIKQLVRIIKEQKIDLIHTHGYKSDIVGFISAKIAGIKCVSTPHGFAQNAGFKLATFIKLGIFFLRYFDAVAPLSDELVSDMKRSNVSSSKTWFIRNGVDVDDIDRSIAALEKVNDKGDGSKYKEKKVIGFIGQMIPRKGIDDLLNIFDGLYIDNNNIELQLIGDGGQKNELMEMASSLESKSAIHFLGFRSDRLALLSKFDLFVMTSKLEGIPRCLMEAMTVGIPVVAYDIPGVDVLVENGVTGLSVPLGDQKRLIESCKKLLEDDELRNRLVKNARDKIEQEYSAKRMAKEYENLFLLLTGHKSESECNLSGEN